MSDKIIVISARADNKQENFPTALHSIGEGIKEKYEKTGDCNHFYARSRTMSEKGVNFLCTVCGKEREENF